MVSPPTPSHPLQHPPPPKSHSGDFSCPSLRWMDRQTPRDRERSPPHEGSISVTLIIRTPYHPSCPLEINLVIKWRLIQPHHQHHVSGQLLIHTRCPFHPPRRLMSGQEWTYKGTQGQGLCSNENKCGEARVLSGYLTAAELLRSRRVD